MPIALYDNAYQRLRIRRRSEATQDSDKKGERSSEPDGKKSVRFNRKVTVHKTLRLSNITKEEKERSYWQEHELEALQDHAVCCAERIVFEKKYGSARKGKRLCERGLEDIVESIEAEEKGQHHTSGSSREMAVLRAQHFRKGPAAIARISEEMSREYVKKAINLARKDAKIVSKGR